MKSTDALFLLVRAGLFGHTEGAESLLPDGVEWAEVYQLAKEQSVVGLAAAGMEKLQAEWVRVHGSLLVPKPWVLRFTSTTLKIEQRNLAANALIAKLIDRMHRKGIHALLVKGQCLAMNYEKPLWRACGDVDLLLSEADYQRAKDYLLPFASRVMPEHGYKKHFGLVISGWMVELHGSLRCGFSTRVDRELDKVCRDTFPDGSGRSWMDGDVEVPLLGREHDVLYVFAHFLNHFYKAGVGVRQICDWCRLLWVSQGAIDLGMLEARLRSMGLMSEWRAFGRYAVDYLGMPEAAMPFLSDDDKWKRKAEQIQSFILKTGNMGHNRRKRKAEKPSFLSRKLGSSWQRMGDLANHFLIFPLDTLRFLPRIVLTGARQK